jgi:hypothetical protein
MLTTLGCDPEVFLQKDGVLLPAFECLPRKGESPFFWDGFQAEFATQPKNFIADLEVEVKDGLQALLTAARTKRVGANFLPQDVVEVDDAYFDTLPIEYVQLGCDPSLNIYGEQGQIPSDPRLLPYRFAGGHIHFGHPRLLAAADRGRVSADIIADLDKILGIWSVGVAGPYEKLKKRRKYYGLAGEFRIPEHGLEYRSLSNFWLASPGMFALTFNLASRVFQSSILSVAKFWLNDFKVTQNTINNYDVEMARKTIKANEKLFGKICGAIGKQAMQACYEGMESIVQKPLDIAGNWGLA